MKFGLTEQNYAWLSETIQKPLLEHGQTLWCYGSRARGDHRPFSDLDLMIEPGQDQNGNLRSLIGRLSERLTESQLPIKVDLVLFSDFAQSYKAKYEAEKVRF